MSDFLKNLVSKSLGLASIIQPRPVSRFEPWHSGGSFRDARLDAENGIGNEKVELPALGHENDKADRLRFDRLPPERRYPYIEPPVESALQPSPSPEANRELINKSVLASAPVTPESLGNERDDSREKSIPPSYDRTVSLQKKSVFHEAHTQAQIIQGREQPTVVTSPDSAPDVNVLKIEPYPIFTQLLTERVVELRETLDRPQNVLPRAAHLYAPPVTDPNVLTAENTPCPVVTPIVKRIERVQDKLDEVPGDRTNPAQMPQTRRIPTRPAPNQQPAAPPTIHVTIGRIEVKAAPLPTPVIPALQAAPKMSLEEYLQSRSGGRR